MLSNPDSSSSYTLSSVPYRELKRHEMYLGDPRKVYNLSHLFRLPTHEIERVVKKNNIREMNGGIWECVNLKGVNLSGVSFSTWALHNAFVIGYSMRFNSSDLSRSNFSQSSFFYTRFNDVSFEGANLSKVKFDNVILKNVNFNKANLKKANFIGCYFESVTFDGADLRGANISFMARDMSCIKSTGRPIWPYDSERPLLKEVKLYFSQLLEFKERGMDIVDAKVSIESKKDLELFLSAEGFKGVYKLYYDHRMSGWLSRTKYFGYRAIQNLRKIKYPVSGLKLEFKLGDDLSNQNLSDLDLSGLDLSQSNIANTRFNNANLSGATVTWAQYKQIRANNLNVDLSHLKMSDAKKINLFQESERLIDQIELDILNRNKVKVPLSMLVSSETNDKKCNDYSDMSVLLQDANDLKSTLLFSMFCRHDWCKQNIYLLTAIELVREHLNSCVCFSSHGLLGAWQSSACLEALRALSQDEATKENIDVILRKWADGEYGRYALFCGASTSLEKGSRRYALNLFERAFDLELPQVLEDEGIELAEMKP